MPRLNSAAAYRSVTSSTVIIQFIQFNKNNDEGDGPVTKYQIQIKKDTEPDDGWTVKITAEHDNKFTYREVKLNGLQYNTLYNIRIVTVYDDGQEEIPGRPSPAVNIKTNCKGNAS